MQLQKRSVSALVTLALSASLAVIPASANAGTTPAPPAPRASVTAECAAAKTGLHNAQVRKAKAKKVVVKAKKKLRKAKKSHRPARIKKAKKVLVKARKRYAAHGRAVSTQNKRVAYACASPTSGTRANATGQKVDLLLLATGSVTGVLDSLQLGALLDRLLPGVTGSLSAGQLSSLLAGFNTDALGLEQATALLGGNFSTAELQSLLAGTASPALVAELADHIIGQLSGLGGGLPIPGSFDLDVLLDTVSGILGTLDPAQLGDLIALLLAAVGESGTTLDAGQLTDLLDALLPGVSALLTGGQLTTMLTAVNGGGLDASALSNLLGGQFSAAQLSQVIGGTASDELVGQVLANIVAQLDTLGGGGLTVPDGLDATTLQNLVSTVTGIVSDLLLGVLGTVGNVVCTLLPVLC